MTSGAKGVPPSIDGYTYVSWLGGGGFADVFLYRQHLPERTVAVKVLRDSVDDEDSRRLFAAEANLMAKVSTHPNIVTIHSAGVSADRRPFLVMEYYPLAHFGERVKTGRVPFQQVLEVGVKIACAVETAHQAQIIHRDIKPANLLASDFGEPGLTDFGISAAQSDSATDESMGFSPPYAPPEILADTHPGDERSDVYSLCTTLWAMLAGHSPFELPGQRNTRADVVRRGLQEAVPALPAGTCPPSLEWALRQGMEKDPAKRPQTAKGLALMLQSVEQELGYRPTQLVLLHDRSAIESAAAVVAEVAEKTKVGKGVVVNPDGPSAAPTSTVARPPRGSGMITSVPDLPGAVGAPIAPPVSLPMPEEPPVELTVKATRAPAPTGTTEAPPSKKYPLWMWVAAGLVVIGIGVGIFLAAGSSSDDTDNTTPVASIDDGFGGNGVAAPAAVSGLAVERVGETVTVTWAHDGEGVAQFAIERTDTVGGTERTTETTFTYEGVAAGEQVCVTVTAEGDVADSAVSDAVCAEVAP
ncbi:MAG: serine/threonine-protein kinase [Ilumatobacteraceae bacterium]